MQVAVCDDDKMCLLELEEQLQNMPLVDSIFPFDDLAAFLLSVKNGNFYDAVFMDIDWGQKGIGIDAAGELYELSPETKIVYVTGYGDRYSQNIFLHSANLSGFLTKPVNNELLQANLKKVAEAMPLSQQSSIIIRQNGAIISLPCHEIYHIESKARTIQVHTVNGVEAFYGKLENIVDALPVWFIHCHKSYVVNMRQIQRFLSNQILLKNGTRIPVSRSKLIKTRETYISFIGEMF